MEQLMLKPMEFHLKLATRQWHAPLLWHFDLLFIIHIYVYIINVSIHCVQVPAYKGTLNALALLSSFLLQWEKLGITSNSVQADIPLCS